MTKILKIQIKRENYLEIQEYKMFTRIQPFNQLIDYIYFAVQSSKMPTP